MGTVWLATDQVLERQVALKEVSFSVDLSDEDRQILRDGRCGRRVPPPGSCIPTSPPSTTSSRTAASRGWSWSTSRRAACRRSSRWTGPLAPDAVARIGLRRARRAGGRARGRDRAPRREAGQRARRPRRRCRLTDFGIAHADGRLEPHHRPARSSGRRPTWRPSGPTASRRRRRSTCGRSGATLLRRRRGAPAVRLRRGDGRRSWRSSPRTRRRCCGPARWSRCCSACSTKDPARRMTPAEARRLLEAARAPGPRPGHLRSLRPTRTGGGSRRPPDRSRRLPSSGSTPTTCAPWPRRRGPSSAPSSVMRRTRRGCSPAGGASARSRSSGRPRTEGRRPPPRRRRRFKRRWVVVPVVVTVVRGRDPRRRDRAGLAALFDLL